jgi:hypothetical protein
MQAGVNIQTYDVKHAMLLLKPFQMVSGVLGRFHVLLVALKANVMWSCSPFDFICCYSCSDTMDFSSAPQTFFILGPLF